MPLIGEYRVVLPMSVEEYEVAKCWADVKDLQRNLKSAKANPVWHDEHGKKLLIREEVEGIPFTGNLCPKVRADYKLERRGQLVSSWDEESDFLLQAIQFTEALIGWCMLEKVKLTDSETWDAYPYYRCENRTQNQALFGKSYEVIMESVCLPGNGQLENALNLPPAILKERLVYLVDIANNVGDMDYDSETDPILYQSEKTGRGPLKPGKWLTSTDMPMMTVYTLITVNFSGCGLSHISERKLQNRALRGLALYHRHLFCGMDKWIGVPLGELKRQEGLLRLQLDRVIEDGVAANAKQQLTGGGDVLVNIEGSAEREQEKGKSEEHTSDTNCTEGSLLIDEDNDTSSNPNPPIYIKEESVNEPPPSIIPIANRLKSELNLFVLSEAALKQNSEDINGIPLSDEWHGSDSGRSTGESFPNGSPFIAQATVESRLDKYDDQTSSDASPKKKFRLSNDRSLKPRRKLILPNPLSSDSSSTSSGPPVVARKTRKRKTKQPIPCTYCGKAFNNQSSLRQHESFHRPTRPFKCEHEKCDKAYKTRSELNRHLVVHSGEKKHFCKLCGKRFLRKQYLKTHLIRHHEITGITMVAPAERDERGELTGKLTAPVVTVASSSFITAAEPLIWRCQLCFKIFVNNEDLNKHLTSCVVLPDSTWDSLGFREKGKSEEHNSDTSCTEGSLLIDEDNDTSSNPNPPTIHIKEESVNEPPPSIIPITNQLKSQLNLLVLAEAALKQNSEDINGIPLSDEWHGSDSGRSTEESFPNGSPFIAQATVESRLDKYDDQTSSDASPKKKFRLSNDRSLKPRLKLILPNPLSSDSSSTSSGPPVVARKTRKRRKTKQPIPCTYCGKAFNNQSSLRQHESFHRPTRPFKCEHEKCDKAYKTRSELNRHLVVHSGEKKHFCKLCGKRFLRKQYLKTHLIRHHETGITMVAPAQRDERGELTGKLTAPVVTVASSSFVTEAEPLIWRCQFCFKIFVNNEDLNKHLRSYHEKKRSEKPKL